MISPSHKERELAVVVGTDQEGAGVKRACLCRQAPVLSRCSTYRGGLRTSGEQVPCNFTEPRAEQLPPIKANRFWHLKK